MPGLTHLDHKRLICLVNSRASLQTYINASSLMQCAHQSAWLMAPDA